MKLNYDFDSVTKNAFGKTTFGIPLTFCILAAAWPQLLMMLLCSNAIFLCMNLLFVPCLILNRSVRFSPRLELSMKTLAAPSLPAMMP